MIRQVRQSGQAGGRTVVEHEVKSGDSTKTYKVTLSTVVDNTDGDGDPSAAHEAPGVVAVMHDVTNEREVAKLKSDFVSHVSHELRTPLASIKAYVELLIDGEAQDDATKREFYEVIQNESNRLGRLIDNLLNISKIESGLVKPDLRPMCLNGIIRDAVEAILPHAARKKIKIHERLAPATYQASADRDMLYQAVLNLLSNAVKYTLDGGEVTVETVLDPARRKVIARVSDTGVGIPPKELPFIFDKFYRAEASSRMAQGSGLGLALVKRIVESVHGGRLVVESETAKGSVFGFELDLV
jgi:two-component system phosphate regulon sensor histidine kinase PhoR